jgi:putative peptidoglycan lipid II flippase
VTEEKEQQARESRSAAVVAVAILISKLAGLLRQRVTAHFFGTSLVADVIAAAFRIGNVAQNLLGEGTLSASFIPIYAKLRAEGKDDEAVAFARAALGMLGAVVIVITAIGVAVAPWLAMVVAAGFGPEKLAMTTRLVRIVFPMTGVLVLCAWALGVLNAHRRFFMPYAAPVVWSAAQIGALLIGGSWLLQSGEALARTLALGALVGAGLELALLLFKARPYLGTLRPTFDAASAHVREAGARLPGVLLGRGVIQISGLVDTLLVSFVGTGANATFAYSQMLYLLPMSLLGTGEAAVSLPEMARDTAVTDEEERHRRMRERLGTTLTRVTVLAIPAMAVLMLFGEELINLLLRTGRFDRASTLRVAAAIRIYGFALLANASVRLYATTFFALGDTKLPARYAVVRVVASTALALALLKPFGVLGVIAGAVTAGWIEAIMLGLQLRRRIGGAGVGELPWSKLVALAALTFGVPAGLRHLVPAELVRTWLGAGVMLAVVGAVFVVSASLLKLFDIRRFLRR